MIITRHVLAALLPLTLCVSEASAQNLLITEVRISSPERHKASTPVDVLISQGRIALIGKVPAGRARNVQRIFGRGKFLSPGFIDSHVHLHGVPGMSFDQAQANPVIVAEAQRQIPRSYLYHGFTSVIDVNAERGTIAAWNARGVRPQAYFCGGAPFMGGYPMAYVPEAFRYRALPYFLWDPKRSEPIEGVDRADHSPEAVVSRMKADGAICTKTHFEPGFRPGKRLPTPPLDLVRSLVSAGDKAGLPTLLHANSEEAYRFGLEAGIDIFAHGIWKWDSPAVDRLPESVGALVSRIVSGRVAVQPTIQVLYGERDLFKPAYLMSSDIAAVLPKSLIEWYGTAEGQGMKTELGEVPYVAKLVQAGRWDDINDQPIARVNAMLRELAKRDAKLLFGSDTPSDQTFANPPGLNGFMEINHWLNADVTPRQMLKALTLANAQFFNLEADIGTVAVGKRADLLLLACDPLTDPKAFGAIDFVVTRGQPIRRTDLSAQAGL